MSHLKELESDAAAADGRALGDEWADWNGSEGGTIEAGKKIFLVASAAVVMLSDIFLFFFVYLIAPRLSGWASWLVNFAWLISAIFVALSLLWFVLLMATATTSRNFFPVRRFAYAFFNFIFSNAFRVGKIFGVSRDRMGHSFVRVSNSISRALKTSGRQEKLLILLPRCLSKEELKAVVELKERYPLEIHTVSGGELARKKVRELKPTAVIGVACERDLVSGIRDVGSRISVIGIPNKRPEGPCKNTHIDMAELIQAVEFYVGPAKTGSGIAAS